MNRREILKLATIAAGTTLFSPLLRAGSIGDRGDHGFGLQIFTVRESLSQDPIKTLRQVAKIGFKEIEMFGFGGNIFVDDPLFGLNPKELRKILDDIDLKVPSTTISGDMDIAASSAHIDAAHELGIKYFVISMAPEFSSRENGKYKLIGVKDSDQINQISDRMNEQGLACRERGITLAYHNHAIEFVPLFGENSTLAFDYMMQRCDPDLLKIELDVGWLTGGGIDPVEYISRYGNRVVATHLKDFNPKLPIGDDLDKYPMPMMKQMVEPGSGLVDFEKVLTAMKSHGIKHGFVEIDVAENPIESISRGLSHLKSVYELLE